VEFQDFKQEINPETPPVELKQLPPRLQYVFLNGDQETLEIINDKLSHEETQKLVATLEKYWSVIGYSLMDLKGISLSLCTHRIPMDLDNKPVQVLKLLKVEVIYPIFNSEWVHPVQVVPKKGGMTVVRNEKNELIPQRTVTG
jgi:hypothetical protein